MRMCRCKDGLTRAIFLVSFELKAAAMARHWIRETDLPAYDPEDFMSYQPVFELAQGIPWKKLDRVVRRSLTKGGTVELSKEEERLAKPVGVIFQARFGLSM